MTMSTTVMETIAKMENSEMSRGSSRPNAPTGSKRRKLAPTEVTNTENRPVTNVSGRVGPKRSISRPWTTEPIATPTSAAAETMPATANDPVARST